MNIDDYQEKAQSFDLTKGTDKHALHALFQFLEEAGEVAGVVKRHLRGDSAYQEEPFMQAKLLDELSDCAWGLAAIAESHGLKMSDVLKHNLAKLEARKAKGTIKGSGER